MADIKMEFKWHKLIEVIMDNSFQHVEPSRILVGSEIWVALREANNKLAYENRAEITEKGGIVVSGVHILYSNYMEPYSMRVVMPENAPYPEKMYGPELWAVPIHPAGDVAGMKQL